MDKKINELWGMMPIFYLLHSDTTFDKSYGFKGWVFIFSLFLLPATFWFWIVGRMFK